MVFTSIERGQMSHQQPGRQLKDGLEGQDVDAHVASKLLKENGSAGDASGMGSVDQTTPSGKSALARGYIFPVDTDNSVCTWTSQQPRQLHS